MNITVTFRHVDASDALRKRATDKIAKLQKFLRQPMTARVTVSLEKLKHEVEARISSGGERYEAHEATQDMYESIDKVMDNRQGDGQARAANPRKQGRRAGQEAASRRVRAWRCRGGVRGLGISAARFTSALVSWQKERPASFWRRIVP
jgi:putative sigma-54 modulation protein